MWNGKKVDRVITKKKKKIEKATKRSLFNSAGLHSNLKRFQDENYLKEGENNTTARLHGRIDQFFQVDYPVHLMLYRSQ